jgi:hypothetical protein
MSVMIVFTCPTSGRDIPVGALPEGQDLATRRDEVSILCQECGQQHTWKYRDGRLAFGDGAGPASAELAGGPRSSFTASGAPMQLVMVFSARPISGHSPFRWKADEKHWESSSLSECLCTAPHAAAVTCMSSKRASSASGTASGCTTWRNQENVPSILAILVVFACAA